MLFALQPALVLPPTPLLVVALPLVMAVSAHPTHGVYVYACSRERVRAVRVHFTPPLHFIFPNLKAVLLIYSQPNANTTCITKNVPVLCYHHNPSLPRARVDAGTVVFAVGLTLCALFCAFLFHSNRKSDQDQESTQQMITDHPTSDSSADAAL